MALPIGVQRLLACLTGCLFIGLMIPRASAQFGGKPSFGMIFNRKEVTLRRKLPPVYDVHGKSISVLMVPDAQSERTNVEIQSNIEKLLTSGDSTVRVEAVSTDIEIRCQISNYSKPVIVETSDGKTKNQTVQGGLSVAFRIVEVRSGHLISSNVATSQVIRQVSSTTELSLPGVSSIFRPKKVDKDKDMQTTFDAQNRMVEEVARQIASYLVITPEEVEVQLAEGGSLNEPDRLAASNLWTRNLESLETLKPDTDPMVDAYRVYNLGVANEALGYAAQDAKAALEYLQQASIDYGKATANKPAEKNFLPAQNRIAAALEHYAEHKAMAEEKPVPIPAPGSEIMTNDDVINMVKANVDAGLVIDAIQSAPKVNFDLSTPGLIKLATNKVPPAIQKVMKAKASPAKTGK